eukprot:scaffold77266_cov70-Phaeocystis_antarctica.AAC.2
MTFQLHSGAEEWHLWKSVPWLTFFAKVLRDDHLQMAVAPSSTQFASPAPQLNTHQCGRGLARVSRASCANWSLEVGFIF